MFSIRMFVTLFSLAVFAAISGLAFLPGLDLADEYRPLVAAGVFVALLVLFIATGIKETPNDPPSRSVLTIFGWRSSIELEEGLNWIPLYGIVLGYKPVNVKTKTWDLGTNRERTPDNTEISLGGSVVCTPGIKDKPGSLKTYLDKGGEEGAKVILQQTFGSLVRRWASSNQEGPAGWKEAQALRNDALEVLAGALLGDVLTKVESDIPPSTWMRFLPLESQSPPTTFDMRPEHGWASVDATGRWDWNGLRAKFDAYKPEEQEKLKQQVEKRRAEIERLQGAGGDFPYWSLGITIHRLLLAEIKATGDVAIAADDEQRETLRARARKVSAQNLAERIGVLTGAGLEPREAVWADQTEGGSARRTIITVEGAQTPLGQDGLGVAALLKGGVPPGAPADGAPQAPPADQGDREGDKGGKRGGNPSPPADNPKAIERATRAADKHFIRYRVYPSWDPKKRRPN